MEQTEGEVSLKYLELAWQNIQHNEQLRNTLFNLYLVIAGVFVVFLGKNVADPQYKQGLLLAGGFVWIIGMAFLWAYARFRQIISRDNNITARVNSLLHTQALLCPSIWEELEAYRIEMDRKKILKSFSVTWCITFSTSMIAAIALSVGLWQYLGIRNTYLPGIVVVVFLLNDLVRRLFEKLCTVRWGQEDNPRQPEDGQLSSESAPSASSEEVSS